MERNYKKMTKGMKILLVIASILIDVLVMAIVMSLNVSAADFTCPDCGSSDVYISRTDRYDDEKHVVVYECCSGKSSAYVNHTWIEVSKKSINDTSHTISYECGCGEMKTVTQNHDLVLVGVSNYSSVQHNKQYECECGYVKNELQYHFKGSGTSYTQNDVLTHTVNEVCICGRTTTYPENHNIGIQDGVCECGLSYTVGQLDLDYPCGMCGLEYSTRHYYYEKSDGSHIDYRVCDWCSYYSQYPRTCKASTYTYTSVDSNKHTGTGICVCGNTLTVSGVHSIEKGECTVCDYTLPTDYKYSFDYYIVSGEKTVLGKTGINEYMHVADQIILDEDCKLLINGWLAMNNGVSYYKYEVVTVSGIRKTYVADNLSAGVSLSEAISTNIANSGLAITEFDKNGYYRIEMDLSEFKGETFVISVSAVNDLGQTANMMVFNGIKLSEETGTGTDTETDKIEELDYTYDVNEDGFLNKYDVFEMQKIIVNGDYVEKADFDKSGAVNIADYAKICDYFTSVGIEFELSSEDNTEIETEKDPYNDMTYDINGDGVLNREDTRYMQSLVTYDRWDKKADLNGDGIINLADYVELCIYFDKIGIDYREETEKEELESESDPDGLLDIELPELDLKRPAAILMVAALLIIVVILLKKPGKRRRR